VKEKAIIVDLDGTLVDTPLVHPELYSTIDWEEFNEKNLHAPAFKWAKNMTQIYYDAGYRIIFLTGRDGSERTRSNTVKWLAEHFEFVDDSGLFGEYELFMRTPKDFRQDFVIKKELYLKYIEPYFDVEFAIDDKNTNIRMFRELGIPALSCAEKE
jgi:predicted secreted acid phosphatase